MARVAPLAPSHRRASVIRVEHAGLAVGRCPALVHRRVAASVVGGWLRTRRRPNKQEKPDHIFERVRVLSLRRCSSSGSSKRMFALDRPPSPRSSGRTQGAGSIGPRQQSRNWFVRARSLCLLSCRIAGGRDWQLERDEIRSIWRGSGTSLSGESERRRAGDSTKRHHDLKACNA